MSNYDAVGIDKSNNVTICLLVSSADNLCKQFRPRSDLVFETLMVLFCFFKKVHFEKKKTAANKNECRITRHAKSYHASSYNILF